MRKEGPNGEYRGISRFIYHFRDNINYNRGGTVYRMSSTDEKAGKKRPTTVTNQVEWRTRSERRKVHTPFCVVVSAVHRCATTAEFVSARSRTVSVRCMNRYRLRRRAAVGRNFITLASITNPKTYLIVILIISSRPCKWTTFKTSSKASSEAAAMVDKKCPKFLRHSSPKQYVNRSTCNRWVARDSVVGIALDVCRWWRKMPEPSPWIAASHRRRRTR